MPLEWNSPESPRLRVRVNLGALRRNARAIRRRAGCKVLFVLKKDAYGHGAVRCAQVLEQEGADYFGVACVNEGLELRRAGLQTPILVFGVPGLGELPRAIAGDLTLTVIDAAGVQRADAVASELGRRVKVHLKIDTGMGRLGEPAGRQAETIKALKAARAVDFEGLYSHLHSGESNREETLAQARRFAAAVEPLDPRPAFCHLANSAGSLVPECRFDMVRTGIALYGASPLFDEIEPVMSAHSRLIQTRPFAPGETISYGATYRVEKHTRVGVVGAGYGDGMLRSLSNAGFVGVGDARAPIRGVVCMDLFMVDLEDAPDAQAGDPVLLFGRFNGQTLPAWELAEAGGSIAYELTTLMGRLAPEREWVEE